MSTDREPRVASLPDDPEASSTNRLLLALGIWPEHAAQVGFETVLKAAVRIRSDAHRFPMAAEDFSTERGLREELAAVIDKAVSILTSAYEAAAPAEPAALEALDVLTTAQRFLDDPDDDFNDEHDADAGSEG